MVRGYQRILVKGHKGGVYSGYQGRLVTVPQKILVTRPQGKLFWWFCMKKEHLVRLVSGRQGRFCLLDFLLNFHGK